MVVEVVVLRRPEPPEGPQSGDGRRSMWVTRLPDRGFRTGQPCPGVLVFDPPDFSGPLLSELTPLPSELEIGT